MEELATKGDVLYLFLVVQFQMIAFVFMGMMR